MQTEEKVPTSHKLYTASVFLCIVFLTFGNYWVFDTPGAIQTQLTDWFGPSYTKLRNSLFYAVYSWPNIVLAFFGGYIVDKVTGVRMGTIMFSGFILIGELLFAVGVQFKMYWVALIGRFIFGLGGESLTVAQNTFTIRWFQGPYIALAFGTVVACARIGSSVNFAVTPPLASAGVPASVWVGVGAVALSFIFAVVAGVLDKNAGVILENRMKGRGKATEEKVSCNQILLFPLSAWLLFLVCLFFYVAILNFYQVASLIFQKTGRHYSPDTASLFLFIPNAASIFLSPLLGAIIDKKGRALNWLIVASLVVISAHVGFLADANEWTFIHPVFLMLWLGLGYSMGAASMWPILSFVIPEHMTSTAYGTMTAVQNLGLAIFPIIIAVVQDLNGVKGTLLEYTLPTLMFMGSATTSLILVVILIGVDRAQHGGRLNASAEERKRMKEAESEVLAPIIQDQDEDGRPPSYNPDGPSDTEPLMVPAKWGDNRRSSHRGPTMSPKEPLIQQ